MLNLLYRGDKNFFRQLKHRRMTRYLKQAVDKILFWVVRSDRWSEQQLMLLEAGANVNGRRPDSKSTPLIIAASFGTVGAMRALLDFGADISVVNEFMETALIASAINFAANSNEKDQQTTEKLKLLLEAAKRANYQFSHRELWKTTNICVTGRLYEAAHFIMHNMDISPYLKYDDSFGIPCTLIDASITHRRAVEFYVKEGASPDYFSQVYGKSLLQLTCPTADELISGLGFLSSEFLFRFLVERGADLEGFLLSCEDDEERKQMALQWITRANMESQMR